MENCDDLDQRAAGVVFPIFCFPFSLFRFLALL